MSQKAPEETKPSFKVGEFWRINPPYNLYGYNNLEDARSGNSSRRMVLADPKNERFFDFLVLDLGYAHFLKTIYKVLLSDGRIVYMPLTSFDMAVLIDGTHYTAPGEKLYSLDKQPT